MALKIPLEITSSGSGKTVAELLAIQKAIEQTAKEAPGISQLAASLSVTYKEAKQLATGLKLTAEGTSQAVGLLKQLNSVNADTATKFKVLTGTLGTTADQFDALDRSVNNVGKTSKGLGSVLQGIGQGVGQAGFGLIAQQVSAIPGKIASTTLQFEKFRTVLKTLYGTTALAGEAFDQIQDFAQATPFQLDEVLQSFIQLKNRGINPTNELLTKFGDIASSQGKGLGQFTEAVLDAQTGEFERLKEFGIQASSAGDKVTFTFKGLTQTVAKTPEAITGAIEKIGELKGVAGGMEAQSKTLGGQLSNLQDNASKAANAFGEELVPVLVGLVSGLNEGGVSAVDFAKELGQNTAQLVQFLANALKVVADNGKLVEIALQLLITRFVALKAVALVGALQQTAAGLIATGTAAGASSTGIALATGALTNLKVALLANLPLLIAVGGAVAAIQTFQFVDGLVKANEALDSLQTNTSVQGASTQNLAGNTKQLTAALDAQLKKTGQLSAAQKKQAADQLKLNEQQLKDLKKQLEASDKTPEAKPGLFGIGGDEAEAQNNARKVAIADTKVQIASLENQNKALTKATGVTGKDTEATNKAAEAAKKAAKAKETYKDKIDAISDATEKQVSQATIAETDALATLAEEEIKGVTSKEQAEDRKLQLTQARINAELEAERDRLEKLQALPVSKDEKEQKAREDAIQKSEAKISQLQLSSTQNRLAEKEAAEKASLDKITKVNEKAQNTIANASKQREVEIQTLLNKGVIDDAEAQRLKLNATGDRINKELALEKQLQSQIANDPNISKDVKEKQAADSIKKIADLQLQAVQNREAIEKAALDRIVAANQKAEAAIAASQTARTTQIRQAVLDRKLSEEDAAKQIEQISLSSSDKIVAAKKKELADIQSARANGSITIAAAAETEKRLQTEIGQITLQRIEAEIQARRRAAELAIDASLGERSRAQQLANQSRSGELGLLQAQVGLQQSLNGLEVERLNTQIAQAEAAGNTAQADQLRLQVTDLQGQQQLALEESQRRELALKQEIRLTDAQIAETEAEIALAKAESAGASERELANLRKILGLRQKQVRQASELNAIDGQVLEANQANSREKQKQAQIQARQSKQAQKPSSTTPKNETAADAPSINADITQDGSRTIQRNKDGSTATLNQAVTQQAVTLDASKLQSAADAQNEALDSTANSAQKFGKALDQATAKVNGNNLSAAKFDQIYKEIGALANGTGTFAQGRAKVEDYSRGLAKQGIDPRQFDVNLGEGKFRDEIIATLATATTIQQETQSTTQGDVIAPAFDRAAASALNLATAIDAILQAAGIAPTVTTQTPQPIKQLFTGGSFAANETFAGNERGAELVTLGGKTALLGDGSPGLFQADRAGYVMNAQQTAAILAGVKPGAIATARLADSTVSVSGGSDRAMVAELQALRADVANLQPDGGEYHFHREDREAMAMTFRLQQGLQRARYGR